MSVELQRLVSAFASAGTIEWIGIRPARRAQMKSVDMGEVVPTGIAGDRRTTPGKRAVTLIQAEHLSVIAALSDRDVVDPAILRRNIVVSGINLLALRKADFTIGSARLRGTGLCAPCGRMEEALGNGGFNAMRGHGGITAEVIHPSQIRIGDPVCPCQNVPEAMGGTRS